MTKRTAKSVVARDPRVCEGVDANTAGKRTSYTKCERTAKWRIRVRARGDFAVCDKHKNKGVLLGPL